VYLCGPDCLIYVCVLIVIQSPDYGAPNHGTQQFYSGDNREEARRSKKAAHRGAAGRDALRGEGQRRKNRVAYALREFWVLVGRIEPHVVFRLRW
jgi:hypothetical protein